MVYKIFILGFFFLLTIQDLQVFLVVSHQKSKVRRSREFKVISFLNITVAMPLSALLLPKNIQLHILLNYQQLKCTLQFQLTNSEKLPISTSVTFQ